MSTSLPAPPLGPDLKQNLIYDLPAGLVVFLVALPLCLGIALASGAPLFSGIIAGVIGGIVVGAASGSEVSVSGPAAGLAVIVAAGIKNSGDFRIFLAAVALSGVIQIVFGLIRGGVIADYVPNSVIKGMLTAIGIVIILKQIPHALGRDVDFEFTDEFKFLQRLDENSTVGSVVSALMSYSPGAVIITAISLGILILWETDALKRIQHLRLIPAPLIVVIFGIALNELFRVTSGNLYLQADNGHLVALPTARTLGEFFRQFNTPNFASLASQKVILLSFTLAFVGSLETLLSIEAADKIDPFKRLSSPNRELFAQGLGNILSGCIGGLPITAVIVRTSANVYAGGRTRLSAIFHGFLLLIAVVAIPSLLNRIPIASLAAILLVVGYKLTKPATFKEMYRQGYTQFLPFIVTVVAIVGTDLLIGIGIGLAFGVFFVIRANHHAVVTLVSREDQFLLRFNKDATFVNKSEVKQTLMKIPNGATLYIDGTKALYIDQDIFDIVNEFRLSAGYRGITVQTTHFEENFKSLQKSKVPR
jgi:MFS superfamily sulfate permease-like transporter